VSHALGRLRYALNDELFVRDPRGLKPTPRALEIGPQVHSALVQLQAAFAPPTFDPATTERRFALMAGSYGCSVLAPRLVELLNQEAPRAQLAIVEFGLNLVDQLDARQVDFILGGRVPAPPRVAQETLLEETQAWTVRPENPLPHGAVTLEELVSVPHVVISRSRTEVAPGVELRGSWEDPSAFEIMLREQGLSRRIGVTTPDSYSAVSVIRQSDMAGQLPRRIASLAVRSGLLRVIEPPYRTPTAELVLLYLSERMSDPALMWMRELLRRVAAEV
jgi:DNA-binding transcriptional LysR family regulator